LIFDKCLDGFYGGFPDSSLLKDAFAQLQPKRSSFIIYGKMLKQPPRHVRPCKNLYTSIGMFMKHLRKKIGLFWVSGGTMAFYASMARG